MFRSVALVVLIVAAVAAQLNTLPGAATGLAGLNHHGLGYGLGGLAGTPAATLRAATLGDPVALQTVTAYGGLANYAAIHGLNNNAWGYGLGANNGLLAGTGLGARGLAGSYFK